MKNILIKLLFVVGILVPTMLSAQSVEQMADIFWNKTSCRELTAERRAAMAEMQTYVETFTHTLFSEYLKAPANSDKTEGIEQWGLMKYYNMALDKLLAEIPATKFARARLWYGSSTIWATL